MMPNKLIVTFHDPEILLFDADSLQQKYHLKIHECLSLDWCEIKKPSFGPCHDSLPTNMFFASVRINPKEQKKI